MAIRSVVAVVAFGLASFVHGQQAVQWRAEDGGNGHWYQVVVTQNPVWDDCRIAALDRGGHLASIGSQSEQDRLTSLAQTVPGSYVGPYGPFVGGFQDVASQGFAEPSGGWRWVDGSPWSFTAWHPSGEPNNCLGTCVAGACVSENVLQLAGPGAYWNDIAAAPSTCGGGWIASAYIIEWSADCNGDGIVDYGQMMTGELVDADGDSVPDICQGGQVRSWGANTYGQCDVPAGLGIVVGIDAGSAHTIALKENGTVACWGAGTTAGGTVPHFGQSIVPAGLSGVKQAAAAGYHSMALRSNGAMVCWGANDYGQSNVPAGLPTVRAIAAGFAHSVALLSDGTVRCWGRNNWGESNVPAGLTGVVGVAAGDTHVVALKQDGTVISWGNNFYGQSTVPAGLPAVSRVFSKGNHNVVKTGVREVRCWSYNASGQSSVPSGLGAVVSAGAGGSHSFAVRAAGEIVCWGNNAYGQCTIPIALPPVIRATGGDSHTVVIVQPVADPCPGDLNASDTVDAEDLAYVLFAWGTDDGKTPEADIDRSGTVDANDLSIVLGSWGACP